MSESALDPLVAEEVLNLLRRLQQQLGLSYLFITHDLGTVKRIAHQVAVMYQGKVVASGDTDVVFRAPMHSYTEKLLTSVPEMRTSWLDDVLACATFACGVRPASKGLIAPTHRDQSLTPPRAETCGYDR